MDAALEIPVAGEHGRHDQITCVDRLGNRIRQRPGIADAGRAAVAHQIEAERVQVLLQARGRVVVGDHLASGCE